MGGRVSVGELVRTFGGTYRAIDVRCAATREGESWTNALLVIRLTYEAPDAARERLKAVEQRYGRVETEHFRIFAEVRPFSNWEELARCVGAGVLRMGNVAIRLRQPVALEDLANEPRYSHYDLRAFDGQQWPGVYVTVGAVESTRLSGEHLLREVGPLGYSNPHEAINDLCEVSVSQGQNPGQEFYISAPVFAQIVEPRLLPFEKKIEVTVQRHTDISGLSVTVFFMPEVFRTGQSSRVRKELTSFRPVERGTVLVSEVASVEAPDVPRDMWVDIRLVHAALGELQQVMRQARSFIPPVERNLLFEALKRFCSEAELEEILVRPHAKKAKKLKESAAFELHVAWLLGLCGLSTVVLGEYERLLAPETKVIRGSVDILASQARSNVLLLVACTMGPPKDEDFANLLNMRGILEREVFAEAEVRIVPVVFTAATESPTYREVNNGFGFIPIVNADGIDTLLALLKVGQEVQFFEFLNNPKLSQLRKPSQA